MTDFFQTTEAIVTAASIYLLVGLGWNLVYNTCGYLNIAIGEFYIIGAVISWNSSSRPASPRRRSCTCSSSSARGLRVPGRGVRCVAEGERAERADHDHRHQPDAPPAGRPSAGTVIAPDLLVFGVGPGVVFIEYQELIVWGTATT